MCVVHTFQCTIKRKRACTLIPRTRINYRAPTIILLWHTFHKRGRVESIKKLSNFLKKAKNSTLFETFLTSKITIVLSFTQRANTLTIIQIIFFSNQFGRGYYSLHFLFTDRWQAPRLIVSITHRNCWGRSISWPSPFASSSKETEIHTLSSSWRFRRSCIFR